MFSARDADVREWLDEPEIQTEALRRNLRDLRRINSMLGWKQLAVRAVARTVRASGLRSVTLLDVASGSADIPLATCRWARQAGMPVRIVATDVSPGVVAAARAYLAGAPDVTVEEQNALALTFPDMSFDIALCTLALHHFAPGDAVTLLRELGRVARHTLVFDLERSPLAYVGALLLTRLPGMHAMTRHDAPASVRRAYTAPELRGLAWRAGLRDAKISVRFPFRLALEAGEFRA